MKERGHKRNVKDIRGMINTLVSYKLLGNKKGEDLIKRAYLINPESSDELHWQVGLELADHMMNNGLGIMPFMEAVYMHPRANVDLIMQRSINLAKIYGDYSMRTGQDVSSTLKNLLISFNFMKNQGKYELSEVGKSIVKGKERIIDKIVKCDHGEPCRKYCPASAIRIDRIVNCIECALCTTVCPHGAISIPCNGIPKMDISICSSQPKIKKYSGICDRNYLKSDELVMQRWIRSVFNLTNLPAEIPGIGTYPDLVTGGLIPSFIEVKKNPLTEKKSLSLSNQIKRYMNENVVQATITQLHRTTDLIFDFPKKYVAIAPESNFVDNFLENVDGLDYPVSFVSFESIAFSADKFLEGNSINFGKIWSTLPENENASEYVIDGIKAQEA